MYGVVATTADWPLIGEIANVLGALMNVLYNGLSSIGIDNVGVAIIVFTVIIFTFMLPLTVKQQRGMRIQQVMQPDIQKIQKKYAGKKDQATMMKQQEEMKLLQQKYGASPFSSCLPILATMPILFALFPVVQNIPRYVEGVRRVYSPLVEKLMEYPESVEILGRVGEDLPLGLGDLDFTLSENVYTLLARLQEQNWQALKEYIPSLENVIVSTMDQLHSINTFLGISVSENPINMFTSSFSAGNYAGAAIATVIPILAGLTQFISVKLQPTPAADPDNPIARQMRTMIYFMPIMSIFFGFTLPAGLGLYWAISAVVRTVQMIFINRSFNKKGTEALIEENLAKAEKRNARRKTTSPSALNTMATKATRNIDESKSTGGGAGKKESNNQTNVAYTGGGSLSNRANMVRNYNAGKTTNEENKGKKAKSKGKEVADEK
jgi:YidC/Oxa1 family membrane protein insertase